MWYYNPVMKWLLRDFLDEHKLTPANLVKAAGTSPATIYGIARGEHERISLEVLDKVLWGLERLTGKTVELSDVLERDPMPTDDQDTLLASGTSGLAEVLHDLERGVPPEELAAWHDAFENDRVAE